MQKDTCEVVSIELERPSYYPEGKGTWRVTVDHDGDEREFTLPENPSQSQSDAKLAEDLAKYQDSDADLVVDVTEHTSPTTPDTTCSFGNIRED